MALQIANPSAVAKVERLAKATGLANTAVIEWAIDRLAAETHGALDSRQRMATVLAQLDQAPDRLNASDPLLGRQRPAGVIVVHPSDSNFGGLFSHALAKGYDFARTDIVSALMVS